MNQQNETKIAPLPWHTRNGNGIRDKEDNTIALCAIRKGEGQLNAAFICRAVNSHSQLLDALQPFMQLWGQDASQSARDAKRKLLEVCPEFMGYLEQAQAALARATK